MKEVTIKTLISLISIVTLVHGQNLERQFQLMSTQQKEVILEAFELGKPFGFEYSLAAICWAESSAGLVNENSSDPSYGLFGILLATALARVKDIDLDWEDTPERREELIELLKHDTPFAATFAIQELRYWQKRRGYNNWTNIWASYNGGNRYKKSEPQKYGRGIKKRINILKKYIDIRG